MHDTYITGKHLGDGNVQRTRGENKMEKKLKKSNFKNINIVKETNTYEVTTHDLKKESYKTLRGAENYATQRLITALLPKIATANTYFWSPQGNAATRRRHEADRKAEMDSFIKMYLLLPGLDVNFFYSESCKNVYKTFQIFINGKKSNVVGLKSHCAKFGIDLVVL